MINALRIIAWFFTLLIAALAGAAFMAYVGQHGWDQRATVGALAGACAFAAAAWFWLIYRR